MERGTIRRAVDERRERWLRLLSDLVAIPTENPPGRAYHECVLRLADELRGAGARCSVLDVPSPDPDLPRFVVRAVVGEGGPAFHFHGHYDVVPAADPAQLAPALRDGRLYGRGASDMKGGLVSMIEAVRVLAGQPALAGRVILHCVPDEETGGALGAEWLDRQGLFDDSLGMLLAEPTSGKIWNAHKGALSMLVHVRGRTAHVGLPHEGDNAVERALPLLQEAVRLRRQIETRASELPVTPAEAARSTMVVGGRISGPAAANAVPAALSFSIDRRLNPEEDIDEEEAAIRAALGRSATPGTEYEIEVFQRAAPTSTPSDAGLSRLLAGNVTEVTGLDPSFELCPGVLETRVLARRGVPALAYGPGLLEVSHGPDEYVELDRVAECAVIYAMTAARALAAAADRADARQR